MKYKVFVLISIIIILICLIVAGNNRIVVTRYVEKSEKIAPAFDGLTIAQISDYHNCNLEKQVLNIVKKEKPDIIFITGDLLDASHTNKKRGISLINQLINIAPVYYVTGNHEAWIQDYDSFKKELEKIDVTVLTNESVELQKKEDKIIITGINDPDFLVDSDADSLGGIEYELKSIPVDKKNYNILLSHRPEAISAYLNFDLVFSGHAHGGQFRIPFVGGLIAPDQGFFPEYDGGKYVYGKMHMIVSRGIGNSIIPIRINNNPEIVITELKSVK